MSVKDKAKGTVEWKLEKFVAKDGKEIDEKNIRPYEIIKRKFNSLLHEGITGLMFHLAAVGASINKWDNTSARIGVGNDGTAPADTQTGLIGASKVFKGMNGGYPQKSGDHDLVFQADFIDGEGEWNWLEETIVNAADDAGDNLCRQNTDLGTKPAGQTWRLTGTVTWT